MSKTNSDLLKEAIADARAVKETALANAKIALQEAFAPRIQSMLSAKLSEELEDEEMSDEMPVDGELDAMEPEMGAEDELSMDAGADVGDLSIDADGDGEFDEFDIISKEMSGEEMGAEAELEVEPEMDAEDDVEAEYNEGFDADLSEIIRELEEGMYEEEMMDEMNDPKASDSDAVPSNEAEELTEDIDEIIESILSEEDEVEEGKYENEELDETKAELAEAYSTVKELKSVLSEVNLLNAKLLYTNKLFRNFELSESQKMKVIENFDRAGNTREVKLVFSTLSESFAKPTTKTKKVVKESYASKPVATTKPKTTVLSEGFEMADRWKKLAGLL